MFIMITAVLVVAVLVLFVMLTNLDGRIKRLEDRLAGRQVSAENRPAEQQTPVASEGVSQEKMPAPAVSAVPRDDTGDRFIAWLKEEWLLKLGALLLLFGFGWLTTYAFLNNWIGPAGRITLGIVAGTIFMILGISRAKKFFIQGSVILLLGSTTILLTTFAAREYYNFFTPATSLALMFLSTVFVAVVSVKYKSRPLALASIILAGIAPLFTNAPVTNYIGLFSYLLVVVLGALWITVLNGKREITLAALILVTFYSLPHFAGSLASADRGTLLLFAYCFTAIFFVFNTIGITKNRDKAAADLLCAAGTGLFLLAWVLSAGQKEWQSLIIAAWMLVFGVGAFMLFRITGERRPFYVYASVAIGMLAAATSVELSGYSLTIAYIVESAVISLIAYFVFDDIALAERLTWLLLGPAVLSVRSMLSYAWRYGPFNTRDFFVLFVMSLVLFGLGLFYFVKAKGLQNRDVQVQNRILIISGSVYAYILIWRSFHQLFTADTAAMFSLIIYTVVALITYFYGLFEARKVFRVYGATLLGFVMARLFVVDIWTMRLAGRIVTFFAVGALLVITAILSKNRLENKVFKV